MAKLSLARVKALRDLLGEDLASFFSDAHGVEDDTPADTADDETAKA